MDISKILNINNLNIEEEVKSAIRTVNDQLTGLISERTCYMYSSYILRELYKRHVLVQMINSKNLDCEYEHYFIITKTGGKNYIIDLTYSQFGWNEPQELLQKGYMEYTKENYESYIKKIQSIKRKKTM